MFLAIMKATPEGRVAQYMDFATKAEADAHVESFSERFPDAFVVSDPGAPLSHLLVDMAAKTVVIDPPPPPDYDAIDQATVDRLLLESGVMRAFALMMFEIGKAGKTGNWSFFDGVTDAATFKAKLKGLIR